MWVGWNEGEGSWTTLKMSSIPTMSPTDHDISDRGWAYMGRRGFVRLVDSEGAKVQSIFVNKEVNIIVKWVCGREYERGRRLGEKAHHQGRMGEKRGCRGRIVGNMAWWNGVMCHQWGRGLPSNRQVTARWYNAHIGGNIGRAISSGRHCSIGHWRKWGNINQGSNILVNRIIIRGEVREKTRSSTWGNSISSRHQPNSSVATSETVPSHNQSCWFLQWPSMGNTMSHQSAWALCHEVASMMTYKEFERDALEIQAL